MSPMPKAQEYRNRAEECIRQAEGCSTETDKNHWLTMAEEWLRMAQQEAQVPGPFDGKRAERIGVNKGFKKR